MQSISNQIPYTYSISLDRIPPKPPTSVGFSAAMGWVKNMLGSFADTTTGLTGSGLNGDYSSLLAAQMQMQKEMMVVSMISNVEKSRHETQMAPVRNIRVG